MPIHVVPARNKIQEQNPKSLTPPRVGVSITFWTPRRARPTIRSASIDRPEAFGQAPKQGFSNGSAVCTAESLSYSAPDTAGRPKIWHTESLRG